MTQWFQAISGVGFSIPEGVPTLTNVGTKFLAVNDGNDGDDDGWFGRCSVCVLPYGRVLCTIREGSLHSSEEFGIIHQIMSDDYGTTWSELDEDLQGNPISGMPLRPTGAGNPSGNNRGPSHGLLILCPNGDLLCQMWNSDYSADNQGAHQARSTDGGLTWGASVQITFGNYAENQNRTFFGEGHAVVGDTIYSAIRYYAVSSPQQEANYVAKSEDNGVTWDVVGQITTTTNPAPRGTQEASLVYLGEGRFLSLLREAANQDGHLSYSEDWCATWSSPIDITTALGIPAGSWLGRTQIKTRGQLKHQSNGFNDRVLIVTGFTGGVDNQSVGARRNATWVGIIPVDYDLENITWYGPYYMDDVAHDGGYGDHFYNPLLDEYVFCSYRSPLSLYDASAKQYNFTLTFE